MQLQLSFSNLTHSAFSSFRFTRAELDQTRSVYYCKQAEKSCDVGFGTRVISPTPRNTGAPNRSSDSEPDRGQWEGVPRKIRGGQAHRRCGRALPPVASIFGAVPGPNRA